MKTKIAKYLALCSLPLLVAGLQGCKENQELDNEPSWLGSSIYGQLQQDGRYTTLLRLIDDVGQHEVLSHTGSRTLFAADDEAFAQWFKGNEWHVDNYGQLSMAQKKLLLNNSMVSNAYLVELLSNVEGNPPVEGRAMRHKTAASVYDSVEIVSPERMPATPAWARLRERGRSIPLLKDATAAPMIHFLPAFMDFNKITAGDLEILTNHQATNPQEAWVNGKKIVERDITCKNGYIQRVDGVIESSPNMAQILRQHPRMSRWSSLINRFSAPYYDAQATADYNRLYHNEDSVYTLRYYSRQGARGENATTPDGESVSALLKFDPGWNQYMYANTMNYTMDYDAGAMLVPTNEALDRWWNEEGRELQSEYGEWDSIPDATLVKLLNVNMLPVFTEAVPSKFAGLLNDAKEELGVRPEDIDSCFMGCNGVVYLVKRVFMPAEYASVAYPALAHSSTMNVIYWAIEQLNFLPYLLAMDVEYSLLLPTNDAMLWYIDPAYYGSIDKESGQEAASVLQFYYDERRVPAERVQARRYDCTISPEGEIALGNPKPGQVSRSVINDCLTRLLDQLIIVGNVEDGHEYYKSKGGSPVRVFRAADGRLAFAGGWQMDHQMRPLAVNADEIYPKKNGRSYQLNDQMPLGTQNSVYLTLKERPEFSEFLALLDHDGADLLASKLNNKYNAGLANQGSKNLRLLDNYNYTVYVPQNDSIRKLIDDGLLPTWDDYEAQTVEDWGSEAALDSARAAIADIIVDFLRYHIQDHSVAVGMASETGSYQNAFESMKRNPETGRFFTLTVNNADGQMWVRDQLHLRQRNVVRTEGLYNRFCREYWFDGSGDSRTTFMASDAVLHQIDGVLLCEPLTPWRERLEQLKK